MIAKDMSSIAILATRSARSATAPTFAQAARKSAHSHSFLAWLGHIPPTVWLPLASLASTISIAWWVYSREVAARRFTAIKAVTDKDTAALRNHLTTFLKSPSEDARDEARADVFALAWQVQWALVSAKLPRYWRWRSRDTGEVKLLLDHVEMIVDLVIMGIVKLSSSADFTETMSLLDEILDKSGLRSHLRGKVITTEVAAICGTKFETDQRNIVNFKFQCGDVLERARGLKERISELEAQAVSVLADPAMPSPPDLKHALGEFHDAWLDTKIRLDQLRKRFDELGDDLPVNESDQTNKQLPIKKDVITSWETRYRAWANAVDGWFAEIQGHVDSGKRLAQLCEDRQGAEAEQAFRDMNED